MSALIQSLTLQAELTIPAAIEAFADEPFLLVLDSAARHRELDSRYSFLTADPVAVCRLDQVSFGVDPFEALRDWQSRALGEFTNLDSAVPSFAGGIAGLMAYELGNAFERLPSPSQDDFRTPALLAGLFDWAIVWDHLEGTVQLFELALPAEFQSSNSQSRRDWVLNHLNRPARIHVGSAPVGSPIDTAPVSQRHRIEPTSDVFSDFTRDEYLRAVRRVIEYIRAGDIFQANLSQRLMAPWLGSATQLYSLIRNKNPAPFCGLLQTDDFAIVSASPERFLKADRRGHVETRPIKGTRRRPRSPIADLYASAELTGSEKDRAENVMIVDLLRNDISRSCSAGSVKVTGLCEIERFETVLHLVSTVVGQLRPECDVWDLMAGCFPGGSITGAPKIRAMEIIAELEPTVRGAYCGSLFALGPQSDFDSSILIRTFTLKNGWVQFPVGGGIVADSDPLDEYRETLHKASGMIRALRAAKD
jgi:para-aminobenzoate synthetase component I